MTEQSSLGSGGVDHERREESSERKRTVPDLGNPFAGYGDQQKPLTSYAILVGLFNAAFAAFLLATKRTKQDRPERIGLADIALFGLATHKVSRIVAHDWVVSPLRAPFTEYDQSIGAGEVSEKPRGRGMQRALGELLTCPWCLGPWVASGFTYGLVLAPRATRILGSMFTLVTISDFLHHVYGAAKKLPK